MWHAPLALAVLYFLTALPSFGWRDSPEFADAAFTLGVAHPAGFPTFCLLTKMAAFLPLGSIPFRINLAVAFFGAAALYILNRLIVMLVPENGEESLLAKKWAASATVLVLGLTPLFWSRSTEIEVYTLNAFFIGLIFYSAIQWTETRNDAWLYCGAFIYGLASGNHAAIGFFLPGLALYFFLHSGPGIWRRFCFVLFFFLAGFAVYLYLPIRAATQPTFNFGDPENWRRFLMHITDRKDANTHFSTVRGDSTFFHDVYIFAVRTTPVSFWILGFPLILFGIRTLWKKNWPLVLSMALAAGANIFFFITWLDGSAFIPAIYIALLVCGVGLAWVLEVANFFSSQNRKTSCRLAALSLAAAFVLGIWSNPYGWDRAKHYLSSEAYRADYLNVPPESILISGLLWFHHRCYQDIYRLREDLQVMLISDFLDPVNFNPISKVRFPDVVVPEGQFDQPANGDYLSMFVKANLDNKKTIYWEPFDIDGGYFFPNLEPKLELLFELKDHPVDLTPEKAEDYLLRLKERLERETEETDFFKEKNISDYYVHLLLRTGSIFRDKGFNGVSFKLYEVLFNLFGPLGTDTIPVKDQARLLNNISTYRIKQGRLKEAETLLNESLNLDPKDDKTWSNLGLLYMAQNRLDEAFVAINQALKINPTSPEATANLGELNFRRGNIEKSKELFNLALTLRGGAVLNNLIKRRLRDLEQSPVVTNEEKTD